MKLIFRKSIEAHETVVKLSLLFFFKLKLLTYERIDSASTSLLSFRFPSVVENYSFDVINSHLAIVVDFSIAILFDRATLKKNEW